MNDTNACPSNSGLPYASCCALLINVVTAAPGPEALTRAPHAAIPPQERPYIPETLHHAPRGDYDVTIESWGLELTRPLTMTRAQEVNLQLFSFLDLLVVVGITVLIIIAPIAVGRPWIAQRLNRRNASVQESGTPGWRFRGTFFVLSLLVATLFLSILITRNRLPDRATSETVIIVTPESQED